MNDHNLDDLIIDNIDPKNSKLKSFLTIIALAIVVLIVAIILTRTVLKDPQQKAILEEDDIALISPELTLQDIPKPITPPKKPTDVENIKEEIALGEEIIAEKEKVQPQKTTPQKDIEEENRAKDLELKHKKENEATAAKEKAKAQEALAAQKNLEEEKEAKKPHNKTTGYFIQVGSFTKTPSTRFLTVIKNSGFSYQITPASSTGTKKLLIGPYDSREEAKTALVRVKDRINKSAYILKK